jgi:hypothetical protein
LGDFGFVLGIFLFGSNLNQICLSFNDENHFQPVIFLKIEILLKEFKRSRAMTECVMLLQKSRIMKLVIGAQAFALAKFNLIQP